MKRILLAAVLLPSAIFAQVPVPAPQPPRQVYSGQDAPSVALPDNYQVTLTVTDKNDPPLEISIVAASARFTASLGEPNLHFNGSMTVEESGIIIIGYSLTWSTPVPTGEGKSVQFRASEARGSVRLKLGEEVQIIRAGSRMTRLSVKKLEASKPK